MTDIGEMNATVKPFGNTRIDITLHPTSNTKAQKQYFGYVYLYHCNQSLPLMETTHGPYAVTWTYDDMSVSTPKLVSLTNIPLDVLRILIVVKT